MLLLLLLRILILSQSLRIFRKPTLGTDLISEG